MKIIFWQNIISPHQSFLIKELAKRHEVILAVLEEMSADRAELGWTKPDTGNAKIVILPGQKKALQLLNQNTDATHIFSGIAIYPIITDIFRKVNKKTKIGVIVEAGSPLGWKKYFRKLLYRYKFLRYNSKIDFVFAMGDLGVKWYQSVGFPKHKIHKFQYFTELPNNIVFKESYFQDSLSLIFIGRLIDLKNVQGVLNALVNLQHLRWKFTIVGDGPLASYLKEFVAKNNVCSRVIFRGSLANMEAMEVLSGCDYLILPSKKDGWGAVINEALSRGVKVITNENCGASCLVKEMDRGVVYKDNSHNQLENAMKDVLTNFKKEPEIARKRAADEFLDKFSYNAVKKFEEVLIGK